MVLVYIILELKADILELRLKCKLLNSKGKWI